MLLGGCFNLIGDAVFMLVDPEGVKHLTLPVQLSLKHTHTYGHTSPYQTAHCGNCHDLIAFLILHSITHFTEEAFFFPFPLLLPTTTCPVRKATLTRGVGISASGWETCDLDLLDTTYSSPQILSKTAERTKNLYQTLLIFPERAKLSPSPVTSLNIQPLKKRPLL